MQATEPRPRPTFEDKMKHLYVIAIFTGLNANRVQEFNIAMKIYESIQN